MQPSNIRGRWANEVDPTPPERFWHDRFYFGAISAIAGPSRSMKSTFTAKIAADFSNECGPVLFDNLEDVESISRMRLEAAGADMDKVRLANYAIPSDLKALEADIIAGGFKLVIMDTAAKHINAPIFKSTDKTARILVPLSKMFERTGAALLLVEHSLKHTRTFSDPLAAIPDGLARTVRTGVLFGYDPNDGDRRCAAWVKDSWAQEPTPMAFDIDIEDASDEDEDDDSAEERRGAVVLRIADDDYSVPDPLALVRITQGRGEGESAAKKAEAAEFLTKTLANGPIPVRDCEYCSQHGHVRESQGGCPVKGCSAGSLKGAPGLQTLAESEGVSWRTIRRAKDAIGVEILKKTGVGKGGLAYWRLPDGHPMLNPTAPKTLH